MEYLLMIHSEPMRNAEAVPEAARNADAGRLPRHSPRRCSKAGVLSGSNRLRPAASATAVRVRDGKTEVLNGPYAETREAARRLLPDRRARSRRGAVVGGALPGREPRHDRSAAGLGDGRATERGGARRLRARPPKRPRAAATASWSPSSPRARATSPRRRGRAVRSVRRRARGLAAHRRAATIPRPGCSPWRGAARSMRARTARP